MREKINNSGSNGLDDPIKIYQILVVWNLVLLIWHFVFSNIFRQVDNVECLQWSATAATLVALTRHVLKNAGLRFPDFLGPPITRRAVPELAFVLALSLMTGAGCWALLIVIEARIDANWTYSFFQLITPREFSAIVWNPYWLVIDLITAAFIVPLTEEIVFRGFILRSLRRRYSLPAAVVFSALIFAVFHLNKSFIGSFVHGIMFALLAIRFCGLYAPIAVHGLYNALVSIAQFNLGFTVSVEKDLIASVQYWSPELYSLVVALVLLILYYRRHSFM